MRYFYCFFFLLFSSSILHAQGSWQQMANFTGQNVAQPQSVALGNYGYVIGGNTALGQTNKVYRYNSLNNTWLQLNDFPVYKQSGFAFEINGTIYVGCGYDGASYTSDVYKYNSLTDSWTPVAPFPGGNRGVLVAVVINGKAYVGLGRNNTPSVQTYDDLFSYDPILNTWQTETNFPGNSRLGAYSFTDGTNLYVGGGWNHMFGSQADFWKYNTTNQTWTQLANPPFGVHSGSAVFHLNGKAFLAGGDNVTGSIWYDQVYYYNTGLNSWETFSPFPAGGRSNGYVFSINGKGYFGGGEMNATTVYPQDLWEFSPLVISMQNIPASICAGTSFNLDYQIDGGTFNSGNFFIAQLSDALGSFASPVAIGNIQATGSGSIPVTIPINTTAGFGYRIRIISTDPGITSTTNGFDIQIKTSPSGGVLNGVSQACENSTHTFSISGVTNALTYGWTITGAASQNGGGTSMNVTFGSAPVSVQVIPFNTTCPGDTFLININPDLIPIGGVINGPTEICSGNLYSYSVTGVNNVGNYSWQAEGASQVLPNGALCDINPGANTDTIFVIPDNNGCVGDTVFFEVISNFIPTVELCFASVDSTFSHVDVLWEKPISNGIDSFLIYRDIAGFGYTQVGSVHYDSLSVYRDLLADPNSQAWAYKIRVKDKCGNLGQLSGFHQVIFQFPPQVSGNDISLDWDPYVGLTGNYYYNVMRDSTGNGDWRMIAQVPNSGSAYIDQNGLIQGTNISYYIEVVPATPCNVTRSINNNVTRSNRSTSINGSLSIPEISQSTVRISPNPIESIFTVSVTNGNIDQIMVLDITGKQVAVYGAINKNSQIIDLETAESGVYFLQVYVNGQMKVSKVVKQ